MPTFTAVETCVRLPVAYDTFSQPFPYHDDDTDLPSNPTLSGAATCHKTVLHICGEDISRGSVRQIPSRHTRFHTNTFHPPSNAKDSESRMTSLMMTSLMNSPARPSQCCIQNLDRTTADFECCMGFGLEVGSQHKSAFDPSASKLKKCSSSRCQEGCRLGFQTKVRDGSLRVLDLSHAYS